MAVGVALALTLANHKVFSTTTRNITAGGAISFQALGSSITGADTAAGADGAPSKSDNDSSGDGSVNDKGNQQLDFANSKSAGNGGSGAGSSETPKASTSDDSSDSVAVAAAISINIAKTTAQAILPNGLVLVAGGAISLRTSANTDAKATSSGKAVHAGSAGIGAGVSVNYVELTNQASTSNTTLTGNGLHVDSVMTDVGGDKTHTFEATAKSGAGSDDIGVAGSLALNIIIDHTEATVTSGAVVAAGTGDVSVLAENNMTATAQALADAEGGSSSVGIGASVAINVLTPNHTWAKVMDGAILTGGHDFTVKATQIQNVTTTVHAGSKGGDAISPAVAIAIVLSDTNASLGTAGSTVSASGNVTVQASYDGTVTTSGDADAAGDSVAVGAIVGLNIIAIDTAGTTTRSIATTGGFVTVASSSQIHASTDVKASAEGEQSLSGGGKSADQQSNDQVKNNDATKNALPGGSSTSLPSANDNASSGNSQSSSQSGQSSGGVSVAAAVSLNWVTMNNHATVAPNLFVSATGAVSVLAQQQADATAKASGVSLNLTADDNVGAAVGFNYVNIVSLGEIGDNDVITGNGVIVTALTPAGQQNDVVAWGLAAAGGKSDVSVAASVGLNIVTFDVKSRIGTNVTLNNTGALKSQASSPMGLQNLAVSGALALGGSAVGAGLALNIFTIHVDALIDTGTHGGAGGLVSVTATGGVAVLPISIPIPFADNPFTIEFTNLAISGSAGTGDFAISGSVVIDILDLRTRAWIADNVQINATGAIPGGSSAEVKATDVSTLKTIAGALAVTSGSAGIGAALIVDVIDKDTRAYIGNGVTLRVAGDVTVAATGGMTYFGLSASAGGSTSAAISGSLVILILDQGTNDGTRAFIGGGAAHPTTVHSGGTFSVTASAPNTL